MKKKKKEKITGAAAADDDRVKVRVAVSIRHYRRHEFSLGCRKRHARDAHVDDVFEALKMCGRRQRRC